MDIEVVKDPSGLWRIKNAPIISTGIEYPLMTGPKTFTESELVSAVAAQADPAIVSPRIKLGHTSGYNEALVGDAEQAFGRIDGSTMAMGDNNQTVFGDYLVPEWLGVVMPIAFPNRSIEGNEMVETVTGKEYEMVINAVSLLGIYWPGCQVLEDLPLWYGGDIPAGVEFDAAIAAKLAASQIKVAARGGTMPDILADADISRIRRQFYDRAMNNELAGVDVSTYWWWIRAERVADDGGVYLIVEDDDMGDLYKFNVDVSKEDVTFSDPTPVRVEYVKAAAEARAAVVAGMASMDNRMVVHASRADTGGPEKPTTKGASIMDDASRKKLAASVGLSEDATEEQITAKLRSIRAEAEAAGAAESLDKPEDDEPATETTPTTETPPATETTPPAPVPPPVEAGTVTVDRAAFEQMQRDGALARQHEGERVSARQGEKVLAALKAGKFPSARRDHYAKLMAADEEGTTALLDSLQPGLIPMEEIGNLGKGDGEGAAPDMAAGLPDDWFPEIGAKRIAAAANPLPVVTQAKEG